MHFLPLSMDPERADRLAREVEAFEAAEAQAGHVDALLDEAFEAALAHLDLPKLGRVVALSEERDSDPF